MSLDLVLVVLQLQTEALSDTISSYTQKGLTFAGGMTFPSLTTSTHPAADPSVITIQQDQYQEACIQLNVGIQANMSLHRLGVQRCEF